MSEPTLTEVRDDIVGRMETDKRLRYVETKQAELGAIVADLPRMERRLMDAIEASRPKNVAAWVMVCVASLSLVLSPVLATLIVR